MATRRNVSNLVTETTAITDENLWKAAKCPNYEINKDKLYPYSELPFIKQYKMLKIPICVNNLISHVDYFGQGRTNLSNGTLGFPNCYNVNYEYALVSQGLDKGRKIPNRIPLSETPDVARIVNGDSGKVITFGWGDNINELIAAELSMKQLFYCPIYLIPDYLQLTFCNTNTKAYLSIRKIKQELYMNICKGNIEAAVILTGCLTNPYSGNALGDVVTKLLQKQNRNIIVYGYKLWNSNIKDAVFKYFPTVFQQLFNGDYLAIINKQHDQTMVLKPKIMQAQGDSQYRSSNKSGWKIIPIWDDNIVVFKLYNIDSEVYLQLSPITEANGDRQTCGSEDPKELGDNFFLEPIMIHGQVTFRIFTSKYSKPLEMPADVVIGQEFVGSDQNGHSEWILVALKQNEKDDYDCCIDYVD